MNECLTALQHLRSYRAMSIYIHNLLERIHSYLRTFPFSRLLRHAGVPVSLFLPRPTGVVQRKVPNRNQRQEFTKLISGNSI